MVICLKWLKLTAPSAMFGYVRKLIIIYFTLKPDWNYVRTTGIYRNRRTFWRMSFWLMFLAVPILERKVQLLEMKSWKSTNLSSPCDVEAPASSIPDVWCIIVPQFQLKYLFCIGFSGGWVLEVRLKSVPKTDGVHILTVKHLQARFSSYILQLIMPFHCNIVQIALNVSLRELFLGLTITATWADRVVFSCPGLICSYFLDRAINIRWFWKLQEN